MLDQNDVTTEDTFRHFVFLLQWSYLTFLGIMVRNRANCGIIPKSNAMGNKYLLIIPCSKRKAGLPGAKIPAIDLYDGPFYRIIRKAFREHGKPDSLDIMLLSAKYGFIAHDEVITKYDQKMTTSRAKELCTPVRVRLNSILKANLYQKILINLGKSYMLALDSSKDILSQHRAYYASGRIGERMHQLKNWIDHLRDEEPS